MCGDFIVIIRTEANRAVSVFREWAAMRCFFDINEERDKNGIDLPAKAVPEQARRLVLAVALEEFRLGGEVHLAVRNQAGQQIYTASLTLDGQWTASGSGRAA